MAVISSAGVSAVTSEARPSASRASGLIGTDLAVRGKTPPPAETPSTDVDRPLRLKPPEFKHR